MYDYCELDRIQHCVVSQALYSPKVFASATWPIKWVFTSQMQLIQPMNRVAMCPTLPSCSQVIPLNGGMFTPLSRNGEQQKEKTATDLHMEHMRAQTHTHTHTHAFLHAYFLFLLLLPGQQYRALHQLSGRAHMWPQSSRLMTWEGGYSDLQGIPGAHIFS